VKAAGISDSLSGPSLYHETQRFHQTWLWVLVGGVAALAWWAFVRQVVQGHEFGNDSSPDWAAWLLLLFIGIGLPGLFLYLRLVLEVTPEQIVIRFRPLHTRVIPLSEVREFEVRHYSAVKEYGGWGIKGWSRAKVAYNVSGNEGVELTLQDGRRVMLGSQRASELAEAIGMAQGHTSGGTSYAIEE
jgi:Family of unknown function (DUF6141)